MKPMSLYVAGFYSWVPAGGTMVHGNLVGVTLGKRLVTWLGLHCSNIGKWLGIGEFG
jgi:hypothetical protein